MNVNKVMIMGNLTRDPETRALPSGMPVASVGIATNRFWTDKAGQRQKETEFHNVVLFGRNAEIVKQYLKKGSSLFVEGRLKTSSWQGKDGSQKYKTEVIAERLQLGPRGFGNAGDARQESGFQEQSRGASQSPNEGLETIEYPEEDINVEDIPF